MAESGELESQATMTIVDNFQPVTCDLTAPYKELSDCFDINCGGGLDDIAACIKSLMQVFKDAFLLLLALIKDIALLVALLFVLAFEPIPGMPIVLGIMLLYPFTIAFLIVIVSLFKPAGGE